MIKRILYLLLILILNNTNVRGNNDGIRFVENKGQWENQVNFNANVSGGKIWLEKNKISYQFIKYPNLHANFKSKEESIVEQHVVWAEFIGANNTSEIIKKDKSTDYFNYFIGNDQSKWISEAYAYSDITYTDFYPKTDFRVYIKNGYLKYDFVLKPESENNIQINFSGQDNIRINKQGELVIETSLGQIIEEKPYAYQIIDGIEKEVPSKFILKKNILTFKLGNYDMSKELILDPTLIFASYNGSPSDNFGMTATYDEQGNLYTGGTVFGADYPTTSGAYNPSGSFPNIIPSAANSPVYGITDIFISKYKPDGTSLIYSTYLGGGNSNGGTEAVHSLICDTLGNLHMFGTTSSIDFPTSLNAFQDSLNAGSFQQFYFNAVSFVSNGAKHGSDIFITKFNSAGSAILGSTFIGGNKNDGLNYNISKGNYNSISAYDSLTHNYGDQFRGEIMLDDLGYIYITSSTYSSDFPTKNAFQDTIGGQQDAVVCKFSPNLDTLIWSSYVGGSDKDAGYSIKLNSNYEAIISGGTCSENFATTSNAHNQAYQGGISDGFIGIISSDGSTLNTLTYFGTPAYDQTFFVEVDRWNSIYTISHSLGNYPTTPGVYSNTNGSQVITKYDSTLSNVIFSTNFGNGNGQTNISPSAFLVDRCGNIYVSGWGANILQNTGLYGMPISNDAYFSNPPNGFDFYLIVLERNAQSLLYATYFGGPDSDEHVDGGTSRFDKNGIVYQSVCAGCGSNDDFPTYPNPGVWSNTNNSNNCNNGTFKFDFQIIPKAQFTVDNFEGCSPLTVTFNNTSNNSDSYLWDFGNGDTTSTEFNPIRTYTTPGTYTISLLIKDSICNTIDTAYQVITVNPPINITAITNDSTSCEPVLLNLKATGATSFIWSTNNQFTDTLSPSLSDTLTVYSTNSVTYYVMATNGECSDMDSVTITYHIPSSANFTLDNIQGCAPLTVNFNNTSGPNDFYLWDFGNGDTTSQNLTPTINYNTPGTYTVTLTIVDSICGSSDTKTATITVAPAVSLTIPNNPVTTCDTALLYANSTGATTFIWSSNSSLTDTLNTNLQSDSLTVFVSDTTTYYLLATNGICSNSASVTVNHIGVIINVPNGAVCSGQSDTLSVINLSDYPLNYFWQPISEIILGETTANPIVNPVITTTYYVTAQNSLDCSASDSAIVSVSGIIINDISITADKDTLYNGEGTFLHANPDNNFTYVWNPSNTLNDNTIVNPFATPTTETTYTALFTELITGCQFYKTYTLYAWEINCADPDVFIPNAFTPNDDLENDVLYVRGRYVEEMELKIYDRWGELLFETTKQNVGWDGSFKGNKVDPAVYVYHLSVKCIDGQEYFKKGNVTVIR